MYNVNEKCGVEFNRKLHGTLYSPVNKYFINYLPVLITLYN